MAVSIIGLAVLPLDCFCIATKVDIYILLCFANNCAYVFHIKLSLLTFHKHGILQGIVGIGKH